MTNTLRVHILSHFCPIMWSSLESVWRKTKRLSLLPYMVRRGQRVLQTWAVGSLDAHKIICLHPRLSRNSLLPWPLPWLQPRPRCPAGWVTFVCEEQVGKAVLKADEACNPERRPRAGKEGALFFLSTQASRLVSAWHWGYQLLSHFVRLPDLQEGHHGHGYKCRGLVLWWDFALNI